MTSAGKTERDTKHELVDFLVRKAFDPVLKAKPGGSDAEKTKLERVQDATRAEIERFAITGRPRRSWSISSGT